MVNYESFVDVIRSSLTIQVRYTANIVCLNLFHDHDKRLINVFLSLDGHIKPFDVLLYLI